jgi:MoxR-like ATPase
MTMIEKSSSGSPFAPLLAAADQVILGKPQQIRLALSCLLAGGHLLIEDLPGVGKTTLAHLLARLLGLQFQRVQFTSDMLPADILGVSIFDRERSRFEFHPGPVFSEVVLADEINRATPKTQSALLEAMEERQVTIDGETRALPSPFFVIATQNPAHQIGTFPLPESQLDRFLMRIELGYPDPVAERELLAGVDRRALISSLQAISSGQELLTAQQAVRSVHASSALIDYVQALAAYTRAAPEWQAGLSPRAALALLAVARAWAWLAGRDHVLPEDVQVVLPGVVGHRLRPIDESSRVDAGGTAAKLIEAVPLP